MRPNSRHKAYAIWVQVDKGFPWIELDGTYDTLPDAWRAVEKWKKNLKLKVVKTSKLLQERQVLAVPRMKSAARRQR
jgi:hypothetical protein